VEGKPGLGLNEHTHAQAAQHVKIIGSRKANTDRTLEPIPVLAADAYPTRQTLVELGNWKQPAWRLVAGS
jgi:hypothetical protein